MTVKADQRTVSLPAKLSRPRMYAVYPLKRIFKVITEQEAYGSISKAHQLSIC